MEAKQRWMRIGASVIAGGEPATITGLDDTRLEGKEYVYSIKCQHKGQRSSTSYNPLKVQPVIN